MDKTQDWYWAAANDGAAGDRFVIESDKQVLWERFYQIVGEGEPKGWNRITRRNREASIEDILDAMFNVVLMYGVNLNCFVLEAAKIPAFAKFLREARSDLCNYISNSVAPEAQIVKERYSERVKNRLGQIVSETLSIEDDWYN